MPPLTRNLFFLLAAIVCMAIALLLSLNVFSGGNEQAWVDGGLLAFFLSFIKTP